MLNAAFDFQRKKALLSRTVLGLAMTCPFLKFGRNPSISMPIEVFFSAMG